MLITRSTRQAGFTIVEVMMAATILVVGFIGMIEALTITSTQIDSARRQTLANQILNHELEKLRLASWSTLSGLPTASTTLAIDLPAWPLWSSIRTYSVNEVASYNGAWYRCLVAHTNQTPPNATYWTAVTSYSSGATNIVEAYGATFTLARTVANVSSDVSGNVVLREVTFTVTMTVKTNRNVSGSAQTFTYTRVNSGYFGKHGLNLTYQRS